MGAIWLERWSTTALLQETTFENEAIAIIPTNLSYPRQKRTSLVVVANAVRRIDRLSVRLQVGILGQIQTIGKGRRQKTLSTGRKEGTAHRGTRNLLADGFGGLLRFGPCAVVTKLADVKETNHTVVSSGRQSTSIGMKAM